MNADFVLMQDKKQSITKADAANSAKRAAEYDKADPIVRMEKFPNGRPEVLTAGQYCPDHPEAGLMGVHKSGMVLLCGSKVRGHQCEQQIPISAA